MDRSERWNSGVGAQLVLLVGSASFNILSDKLGEIRPPEFSCNKLVSFEITWVASSFMVMAVVDFSRSGPAGISIKFDWVHGKLPGFDYHTKVFHLQGGKLALLQFQVEV